MEGRLLEWFIAAWFVAVVYGTCLGYMLWRTRVGALEWEMNKFKQEAESYRADNVWLMNALTDKTAEVTELKKQKQKFTFEDD